MKKPSNAFKPHGPAPTPPTPLECSLMWVCTAAGLVLLCLTLWFIISQIKPVMPDKAVEARITKKIVAEAEYRAMRDKWLFEEGGIER